MSDSTKEQIITLTRAATVQLFQLLSQTRLLQRFIMFALFYYIIDVQGYRRWCYFFKVIGVNSITIYLAQRFISFGDISRYFTAGLASHLPDGWGAVLISVGYITACWLLLYFLDRKGVYLKV